MAPRSKVATAPRAPNEIRALVLQYFYERSRSATSSRGARGVAAKISDVKRDLKSRHGLSQQEVVGNLHYLISQGWIDQKTVSKNVPLKSGVVIPQSTDYYSISAAGVDKIEGSGEYTMDKFKGIRIEATGQNIITVGDGNRVDARYRPAADALVALKDAIRSTSELPESRKIDVISDVDAIQSQLAKSTPTGSVVRAAWEGIKGLGTIAGLTVHVAKVAELLQPLF